MGRRTAVAGLMVAKLLVGAAPPAGALEASAAPSVVRQSLDDAWWTGPLLAPSATTLARGRFATALILYDEATAQSDGWGSLAHLYYGLADRVTVELTPSVGFNTVRDGKSSSGVGLGDVTVQVQYRLTQFREGSGIPTTSLVIQETLPSGKYDRLGDRPSDGLGSGAYATTLGLYSQMYFWLPTGRILRMRLDIWEGFSNHVNLEGVSVYGTEAGFRGRASPGRAFLVDAAWEYSLTRKWVLALDVLYQRNGSTAVTGYSVLDPTGGQSPSLIRLHSGLSSGFGFAPAVEYSWKRNLGVVFGTRIVRPGRNMAASITPVVGMGYVR